jgi:hypothetical protein
MQKESSEKDVAMIERETLARLLATPPNHKTKPKPDASPKKRGRPPKKTK